MNIKGLDYNTHREKLLMPEYGREIQKMVESHKELDIDWPFDVSNAEKIHNKPQTVPLPQ